MAAQQNTLQAMVDGLSAQYQEERRLTQMTLGTLIDLIETLNSEQLIHAIISPHSYRGYYIDLAFEPMRETDPHTVGDVLRIARGCMGEVFTGWKGGDFQMGRNTPIWEADHGSSGRRIMDLDLTSDVIVLKTALEE